MTAFGFGGSGGDGHGDTTEGGVEGGEGGAAVSMSTLLKTKGGRMQNLRLKRAERVLKIKMRRALTKKLSKV